MARDSSEGDERSDDALHCPACNAVLFEHLDEAKARDVEVICTGCGASFDLEGFQCEVGELDRLDPRLSIRIQKAFGDGGTQK